MNADAEGDDQTNHNDPKTWDDDDDDVQWYLFEWFWSGCVFWDTKVSNTYDSSQVSF